MAEVEPPDLSDSYFERDYGDNGTIQVVAFSAPPPASSSSSAKKRKTTGKTLYTLPLYIAVNVDEKGDVSKVADKRYVAVRPPQVKHPFFILREDFEKRVSPDETTYTEAYKADWAKGNDALACDTWDADCSKFTNWPGRGLLASKSAGDQRVVQQRSIWDRIAARKVTLGASRLWRSLKPIDPPIALTFAPLTDWPTKNDLTSILKGIWDAEVKKNDRHKMNLTQWLKYAVVAKGDSSLEGLVRLSNDMLGFYAAYVSVADMQRLIETQTGGQKSWARSWPTEQQAKDLQDAILKGLTNSTVDAERKKSLEGGLPVNTHTSITQLGATESRVDASTIMGKQSANVWGKKWWPPLNPNDDSGVAEWLHRSAYTLGDLVGGSYQSPDNLIFGIFEANSDMTRAEAIIRALRDAKGITPTGSLNTIARNDGPLQLLDYTTGKEKDWDVPAWIGTSNYSWLASELGYSGSVNMLSDYDSATTILPWKTKFQPFSRQTPLTIQGMVDTRLLKAYMKKSFSESEPKRKTRTVDVSADAKGSEDTKGVAGITEGLADTKVDPSTVATREVKLSADAVTALQIPVQRLNYVTSLHTAPSPAATKTIQAASNPTAPPPTIPPSVSANSTINAAYLPSSLQQRIVKAPPVTASALHPVHQAAWNAIKKGAPSAKIGTAEVKNPHVLKEDGTTSSADSVTPPAEGFVLQGDVELFGLPDLQFPLQSWHGPPPSDIEVTSDVPAYQTVSLPQICPAKFLPLLESTPFVDTLFKDVTFTYQNYRFDETKPLGWSMTAATTIDEKHQGLYTLLHNVLGVSNEELQVQVTVGLGLGHSWSKLPSVSSFVVQGILQLQPNNNGQPTKGAELCPGVNLTSITIQLFGVRVSTRGIDSKDTMEYGFGISGELGLDVPASVAPVPFDFNISEFGGVATLSATVQGNTWKNVLGSGLTLNNVSLNASFELKSLLKSLDLSLVAVLQADSTQATITGTYSSGGSYSLSAVVDDLGVDGVIDLFRHYAGGELALPADVDVTIGTATLSISKDDGLTIELDQLEFDDYTSSSATIHLSKTGVLVHGTVDNVKFSELDVELVNAFIQVSFVTEDSGKTTDVSLGGEVRITGLEHLPTIAGAVHLYKVSTDAKSLDYTIYGSFTDIGNSTTLGQLFSQCKGTFLQNLALQELAVIVASRDDPNFSGLNEQTYPIRQGIQICAILGQIDQFSKLMRRDSFPGLILSATYSKGAFSLGITVPAETSVHLGHNVSTDPIEMLIQTEPHVMLQINAGVKVPVAKSNTPLDFIASLTIVDMEVHLAGQMNGYWRDPFGVSNEVAIGPALALEIGIDLLVFPETGLPTVFGFAGGMAIGEVVGNIAVEVADDPLQELLEGSIQHLGIQDVVDFTNDITGLSIPQPPDFLDFENVTLYMSTGVMIGTLYYPPGFSFNADIKVFDLQLHAGAAVTNNAFIANADIPAFHVGPLSVKGNEGQNASFSLEVGASTQRMKVDGAMSFLDVDIGITLDMEIQPTPLFSFDFMLQFTPLWTFAVDAQTKGHVDLHNLKDVDFYLHALFEQHILDYVQGRLVALLEQLKNATDQAIEAAEQKVNDEEKKLQGDIATAQAELMRRYQAWQVHSYAVHTSSQKTINDYVTKLHVLQADVDQKRLKYNRDLQGAQLAVQHANADRAAKMRAVEADLQKTKNEWDAKTNGANADLERARMTLSQKFGNVEHDIQQAKAKVDGLQNKINSINQTINSDKHAKWYQLWKKAAIPGLYIELGGIEASKTIADHLLNLANDAVKGGEYLTVQGAVPLAEKAVAAAQNAGNLACNAAEETVHKVDSATQAAMQLANQTLQDVQKGGDGVWRAAESTLNVFVEGQKDILTAAETAVTDLTKSTEWLAYQTASAGLSSAQHATHALDVANKALADIKSGTDSVIHISEEVITEALSALDITKIELTGSLKAMLGTSSGEHFSVSIAGTVGGKAFEFDDLSLNMKDTAQLIKDTFTRLIKHL